MSTSQPTIELRVQVNGQVVTQERPVPLKLGESAALKVEVVRRDGSVIDVTRHPKTSYFSTTPWILSVTSTGTVTATTTAATTFGVSAGDRAQGAIAISYGVTGDAEIGATSVLFEVALPPEARPEGALQISAPRTTLGTGETVQLTVIQKFPDGSQRDVTASSAGTTYSSTDTFKLVVEPDGQVTCVGTRGRPEESAIVGARNAGVSGSISFRLLSKGPGPSLEVTADKTVLREGEQTELRVYRRVPGGGREEVTAATSGTRYSSFSGESTLSTPVVSVNEAGVATAMKSLGRYNWLSALIFVRNGDDVGWIELRVSRTGAK
jgi:hypothetical protein